LYRARTTARAGCTQWIAGRSLSLDLMLYDADPIMVAHTAVIYYYCQMVWSASVDRLLIFRTFWHHMQRLRGAPKPFALVQGPISAVVATLLRLGCSPRSPTKWELRSGAVVNIMELCPNSVRTLIRQAVEAYRWQLVSRRPGNELLARGGILKSTLKLVHSPNRGSWTQMHGGHLHSLVVGGQWAQHDLWKAGLVASPLCAACGLSLGTIVHRIYKCCNIMTERAQYGLPDFIMNAYRANPHLRLWRDTLVPDPTPDHPPPILQHDVVWITGDGTGTRLLMGDLFGDGSGKFGDTPLMRCGWAVLQTAVDAAGCTIVIAGIYGALPGWIQAVPAAESWAFLMALTHCLPPIVFYNDCQFVVDRFVMGEVAATAPDMDHADIWRKKLNCCAI
jgi:hypothetical protein